MSGRQRPPGKWLERLRIEYSYIWMNKISEEKERNHRSIENGNETVKEPDCRSVGKLRDGA